MFLLLDTVLSPENSISTSSSGDIGARRAASKHPGQSPRILRATDILSDTMTPALDALITS
jgi:hypothetical protein